MRAKRAKSHQQSTSKGFEILKAWNVLRRYEWRKKKNIISRRRASHHRLCSQVDYL